MPAVKTNDGLIRPGVVQDYKQKFHKLQSAWSNGIGLDDCGYNLYRGLNAVTQVESSPKATTGDPTNTVKRTLFGTGTNSGRKLIERAELSALSLVSA